MAEEETNSMDRQTSSEHPNHPIGVSVAPERKKPKHHQPCEDQVVEPHNPFDADQAESQRQSPVTRDEYSTHDETELQAGSSCAVGDVSKEPIKTEALASSEDSGRERLKRHRVEVAGSVGIPDMWGQEELMKDWVDCSVFDASLVTSRIMSARAALVAEGRRPSPSGLRIENRLLRIELWLASKLICLCAPVGALLNQSGKWVTLYFPFLGGDVYCILFDLDMKNWSR